MIYFQNTQGFYFKFMDKAQKYELMYIIPNTFTESESKKINGKTMEMITKNGGKILSNKEMGKQKLAYPIQNLSFGYYHLVFFKEGEKTDMTEINNLLKLSNEIIRFLLIKKDERVPKKKKKGEKTTGEKQKVEKKIEKVVKNEKIEKKTEKKVAEEVNKKVEEKIENKVKEEDSKKEIKEEITKKKNDINLKDLDKKLDDILNTEDLL